MSETSQGHENKVFRSLFNNPDVKLEGCNTKKSIIDSLCSNIFISNFHQFQNFVQPLHI